MSEADVKKIAKSVGISPEEALDAIDLGVRWMFLAPEPEMGVSVLIPEAGTWRVEVRADGSTSIQRIASEPEAVADIIEACRRGQKSKS